MDQAGMMPINYLQDAPPVATIGDEIWVAEGIYRPDQGGGITPGGRTATFQLINSVIIKGGYAGFGEPDPNARDIELYETILSGDLLGNDTEVTNPADMWNDPSRKQDNSLNVVTGNGTDETAILDGFIITAGYNTQNGGGLVIGGLYGNDEPGSPTINNCTFKWNTSEWGGGMCNVNNSNPTVTNCTFSSNYAMGGGGMYNSDSSPMLTNCTFSGNSAGRGGGVYIKYESPIITNCRIVDNYAGNFGAGMYVYAGSPMVTNCIFSGNTARGNGGGISCWEGSAPKIQNCIIENNSGNGGGIYNNNSSMELTECIIRNNIAPVGGSIAASGGGLALEVCNSKIRNCIISNNLATGEGGAIFSYNGNVIVQNCVIIDNQAHFDGGAITCYKDNISISNCLIAGNRADGTFGGGFGGGIDSSRSTPTVMNCTLTGNSAVRGGAFYEFGGSATIINSILWGNTAPEGPEIKLNSHPSKSTSLLVSYSDIQGGTTLVDVDPGCTLNWSLGNIDTDPLFIDANGMDDIVGTEDDNLRLSADSLCIDVGDPNYIPEPNAVADLDGNPRVANNRIDMGAYEYLAPVEVQMQLTPATINRKSKGKWLKAHIMLPEGISAEDIDVNEPAFLEPVGISSEYIKVLGGGNASIEIGFDHEGFCDALIGTGVIDIEVFGFLTTGQEFFGSDTVKVK